jgi:hypothetical protein
MLRSALRQTSRALLALAVLAALPAPALAGSCDALVAKASTAEGDALVKAYQELLACDKAEAEAAYNDFLQQTGDVETLTALSLAAIDAKAYAPVWNSLDKIKDYGTRDEAAKAIGAACTEHPEALVFLKGAYFGLKDIQFAKWDEAYAACPSEDIDAWLEGLIKKPPETSYDEKYNTLLSIWVKRKGKGALEVLTQAAITAAGNGGPFNAVLEAMDRAVQPEYGADLSEEDRQLLRTALVEVARNVEPEKAKQVADRLYDAGAEAEAASLLPRIYPDRVQEGGKLLYGVAAIESCDKEAVIHYREVLEPAKRWSILGAVEEPVRAEAKAKLKCDPGGPWPVVATPEPVASSDGVDAWVEALEQQWVSKGYDVKTRSDKELVLD